MKHIWEINEDERTGVISREAHEYLLDIGVDELKKSRASVIFFLDDMVEEAEREHEDTARRLQSMIDDVREIR